MTFPSKRTLLLFLAAFLCYFFHPGASALFFVLGFLLELAGWSSWFSEDKEKKRNESKSNANS